MKIVGMMMKNFPNTRVKLCFFHFCLAMLQQVGRLDLRTYYINNQEIRKKNKNANGISIFAGELCIHRFRNLKCWDVSLVRVFTAGVASVKIPLWNVHGAAMWTNNHLEGWQRCMNKRACKHHLGFYPFLRLIIDEQNLKDMKQQKITRCETTHYLL
ncbi:hypothetical protein T12_11879 [Trichinella patagoniensis]|uniref:MULE transposase domain-containing protein n=1 Tax=Trichinella patagoniensis TaxID=990121 RepID=A0A0V0ZHV6_9BILA|nr:hypothetical protein T12_11879 [Trichinella patagoniensis]